MLILRGALDRLILLVFVLAGGTAPSFVSQYEQRLAGHLAQVQADLAAFEEIAERHHQGSLDALVAHHLASTDPTFVAEGAAIQAMVAARSALSSEVEMLAGSTLPGRLVRVLLHGDRRLMSGTWDDFSPAFVLTSQALLLAGVFGVVAWLLFQVGWLGSARAVRRLRRRRLTNRQKGPPWQPA